MQRNHKGRSFLPLIFFSLLFTVSGASWLYARHKVERLAISVEKASQTQYAAASDIDAIEESVPDSNRPQGAITDPEDWLAIWREIRTAAGKISLVFAFGILFGLWWARDPRST